MTTYYPSRLPETDVSCHFTKKTKKKKHASCRYKEFQTKLDLAREMRVVPGARPPAWQWKITKRSRIRVLEKVSGEIPQKKKMQQLFWLDMETTREIFFKK